MNSGQYYKAKTKQYFIKLGYVAEMTETLRTIKRGNITIYQKNDLLGSDVIAVNATEVILANSVLGKSNIAKHIKRFKQYPSGGMKRVIVIWEKNAREPEIRDVKDGIRNKVTR